MYLVKRKDGAFIPYDNTDHELSSKLPAGSVVKATAPRNYQFHKKAMALLGIGHENQDKTESFEVYRKLITIRAGFFDEAPDRYGQIHYIPKSLSFDSMSAETFEKWYNATLDVIASDMQTATEDIIKQIEAFY